MKTRLTLVRHGQTAKNVKGVLHSRSDESVLSELGRRQISVTARRLKGEGVDLIYSSKETRALESARLIAEVLGKEPRPLDGLEERNWGVFEGRPWSEVKAVLDPLDSEQRYEYVPENGESWKDFETRTNKVIKEIIDENQGKNIVIVTHGGVIRVLLPHLLHAPKEESFKYDPKNASVTILDYYGEDAR
ncbi:MAG: histidine phosphatase family protein [Patescibacteria group bacterium]